MLHAVIIDFTIAVFRLFHCGAEREVFVSVFALIQLIGPCC